MTGIRTVDILNPTHRLFSDGRSVGNCNGRRLRSSEEASYSTGITASRIPHRPYVPPGAGLAGRCNQASNPAFVLCWCVSWDLSSSPHPASRPRCDSLTMASNGRHAKTQRENGGDEQSTKSKWSPCGHLAACAFRFGRSGGESSSRKRHSATLRLADSD